MRRRSLAAAILAAGMPAPALVLAAGDAEKVDCASLNFSYAPLATVEWSECYRFAEHEALGDDRSGSASWQYEHMMVDQGSHVVRILEATSQKGGYFPKRSIRSNMALFDELTNVASWADEDDYKDYQLIRFKASLWQSDVDCVGFVLYQGVVLDVRGSSLNGARKARIGYDCWRKGAPHLTEIESTLDAIR